MHTEGRHIVILVDIASTSFVEWRLFESSRTLGAWQHLSRHLSATNTLVNVGGILSLPSGSFKQSICQRTEYQGDTATSASQSVENQRVRLKV